MPALRCKDSGQLLLLRLNESAKVIASVDKRERLQMFARDPTRSVAVVLPTAVENKKCREYFFPAILLSPRSVCPFPNAKLKHVVATCAAPPTAARCTSITAARGHNTGLSAAPKTACHRNGWRNAPNWPASTQQLCRCTAITGPHPGCSSPESPAAGSQNSCSSKHSTAVPNGQRKHPAT